MQQPWYKQFWPWFLISLPVTVMIVCGVIIYLSVSQGNFSMVVDDYYKRGKTINAIIEHVEEAQRRDISFEFIANNGVFELRYKTGRAERFESSIRTRNTSIQRFRFNGDRQRRRNLPSGHS